MLESFTPELSPYHLQSSRLSRLDQGVARFVGTDRRCSADFQPNATSICAFIPEGWLKIAQPFKAGTSVRLGPRSPVRDDRTCRFSVVPDGTYYDGNATPSLERLGYFRLSLRNSKRFAPSDCGFASLR